MDLCALSATELGRLLDDGAVRAVEIAEAYLERISQRDATTGAWAHLDPELVLEQARLTDASPDRAPLGGIPIGIKDSIDTNDFPTSYGSRAYREHRPSRDAELVGRLRRSGALILGKTSTTEFMSPLNPPARNPIDPSRTPGTSSSGSAAAVADQTAPVAIGTQTGGSLIRPASYCGVYGYKGRTKDVPRRGLYPLRPSLDSIGLLARSISDIELVWPVIADSHDRESVAMEAPSDGIAMVHLPWPSTVEPATIDILSRARKAMVEAGFRVIDLELPDPFPDLPEIFGTIATVELSAAMASHMEAHPSSISAPLEKRIRQGQQMSAGEYEDARHGVRRMKEGLAELLMSSGVGLMVTASTGGEAPRDLSGVENSSHNQLASLMDLSAMSIPFGRGPNDMPIGIQIMSQASLISDGSDAIRRIDGALSG